MSDASVHGNHGSAVLPVIPLREKVIFPRTFQPIVIGRPQSLKALEQARQYNNTLIVTAQMGADISEPGPEDVFKIGTRVAIVKYIQLPDKTVKVMVSAHKRVEILEFIHSDTCFMASYRDLDEDIPGPDRIDALMNELETAFRKFAVSHPKIPKNVVSGIDRQKDPDQYVDTIASLLSLKLAEAQELLETTNFLKRIERVYEHLISSTEILQLEQKIKGRVKTQLEHSQKEWYLHEQMKAIQKELGKENAFQSELDEIRKQLNVLPLTKEAREKIERESKRLEMMPPMNPEASVCRDYIHWIISLPWGKQTRDRLNLHRAKIMLDEDHYGLEKVKERIIEYLAVRKLTKNNKGPILCFVGPPGVGKTSLAQSIARTTGRKFVRLSLGGVRDEAEIRGHRRTYIGALPGRIMQSVRKADSMNPVFLLDEVDKMSTDFRGDPAAALLEVLDPEQNHAFSDHYLEIGFDLSRVMFITTANTTYRIPPALLDRMEILRLPGYTDDEKIMISRHFLVPKQLSAHGLQARKISFTPNSIQGIIRKYTREAGVRNLERELATICRKIATQLVEKKSRKSVLVIKTSNLQTYLGVPKYSESSREGNGEIGVSIALAYTEFGGETLQVETIIMPGNGKLTLTGKMGEVMQESAKAALSYVRSKSKTLGLEKDFHKKYDIHIHVPEGAIPKDGPSAGIAIASSLISAATQNPLQKDVAMTGEITIRGRILPVGGLKEKILAAHRMNIKKVLISEENKKHIETIPKQVRKHIRIIPVKTMDQVLKNAFCEDFQTD